MSTVPASSTITQCVLCGDKSSNCGWVRQVQDYLSGERFDIVRCPVCGLLSTSPCPGEAVMGRYYPPQYRGNRHGFTGRMRVVLRRRAIESQFPPGFKGRLLDIGAGDGSFALEMQRRGWKVAATEIDPGAVGRLAAQGIDGKISSIAEVEGFADPFDAVTAWHVLEHVEFPRHVADWAFELLQSGGVFQATVPNAGGWQAKLFKTHWLHLDVPRHRYHFTPGTFGRLLSDAGFAVTKSNCLAIEYDWFGVIQSALNTLCSQKNILFDFLTRPVGGDNFARSGLGDRVLSLGLCAPLAALSFGPVVGLAAFGNGATLTLTTVKSPPVAGGAIHAGSRPVS